MNAEKIIMQSNIHLIRMPLIYGLSGAFLLAFSSLLMDLADSIGLNEVFTRQLEITLRITAWVVIFTALAMLINRYLKTGFSTNRISISESNISFGDRFDSQENKYSDLELRLKNLEATTREEGIISNEDKAEILESLKEKLSDSLQKEYIDNIRESLKKQIIDERINFLRKSMEASILRLSKEVGDLGRRGNLNLMIGALATLAGFLIFGAMVLDSNIKPTPENFLTSFIPRLSLVILIEVFAYFFLSLYKSSLSEIKYFQNEITNIEIKYSAMEYAVQYGDKESISKILMLLSTTERNFLLKKGESTVLLEQDRLSSDAQNSLLQKITDLISSAKAPNK